MSILTREGSVLDIAGTSGVSIDIKQLLANIFINIVLPDKSFADLLLYVLITCGTRENNPQPVPINETKFAIAFSVNILPLGVAFEVDAIFELN